MATLLAWGALRRVPSGAPKSRWPAPLATATLLQVLSCADACCTDVIA